MVEYALVLVLVALGSIVILGLAGVGVQRLYGVVSGVMGARRQAGDGAISGQVINITGASCYVYAPSGVFPSGYIGYFLKVETNIPLDQLNTAGTEQTLMLSVNNNPDQTTIVAPPGTSHITFEGSVPNSADSSLCPRVAIVQSIQGSIAVRPVDIEYH